jgi:deazaflavin-dependent oxidoreductase (nitroreductase family)
MTPQTPPGGTHGARSMGGPMIRFGARMMSAMYRRSGRMASSMVLIAASAQGSAKNPAWLHNLAVHPDQVWIELGKDKVKVRPEILAGDERAAAWARIVAATPQFGKYETQTDREIAVVRLAREP